MIEELAEFLRNNKNYQVTMQRALPTDNSNDINEIRVTVNKYLLKHPFTRSMDISVFNDGGSDHKFIWCIKEAKRRIEEQEP